MALHAVLSARAEVGRAARSRPACSSRALRASGGGSLAVSMPPTSHECSPRERRWVRGDPAGDLRRDVLSARAEVGRGSSSSGVETRRALRASGGGSASMPVARWSRRCSPRERRWVARGQLRATHAPVLSARAEVGRQGGGDFSSPLCALRASGGGSIEQLPPLAATPCSPRERRWVGDHRGHGPHRRVLSARAEVGRWGTSASTGHRRALRASGGGSPRDHELVRKTACSPRERRWVAADRGRGVGGEVLSARAEVGRSLRPS